jgi:phage gp46-like protein
MPVSSAVELSDIALGWSNATGDGDVMMLDGDIASDRGMYTAIVLSLFTDRRAATDDVPPSGNPQDLRGWWADEFAAAPGDLYGSRLWLLDRSTLTNQTALLAQSYAEEALQWMVDDGAVASIPVTAQALAATASAPAQLSITVSPTRPGQDPVSYTFTRVWNFVQEDTCPQP